MNFVSNSFTTQRANPIALSLIFISTSFYWKFVCTDSKFCDCLPKFGIFHSKIVFKTWTFFNFPSLYFLWFKWHSSSKSFLRVVLLNILRLARGLISLALNISVIMPIPVSHEGLPSFCNCLFVINTAFKIGLRNSLILSQYLAIFKILLQRIGLLLVSLSTAQLVLHELTPRRCFKNDFLVGFSVDFQIKNYGEKM